VVGCYLARHGIASGNKALEYIKTLRRCTIDHYLASPETPEQIRMVVSWGEGW
jgi:enoyl reductase-like protein